MGKRTVKVDEPVHEKLDKLQTLYMKEAGVKPSFEEIIQAGLERDPDQLLQQIRLVRKLERQKEKRDRKPGVSEFDKNFSL